jgi:predicted acyl esterase
VPEPRIGFLQEALRWWDRHLKGIDTGVLDEPMLRVVDLGIMDSAPSGGVRARHIGGRWVAERRLAGGPRRAAPCAAPERRGPVAGTPGLQRASARCLAADGRHCDAGDQCSIIWPRARTCPRTTSARDDAGSLTFDSAPLTNDIDIVGAAVLQLLVSADKPVAHVAVRLNQVWPDGAVSRLSYAVFNLCHRDGHEHPQPLEPGKRYRVRIPLDDVACKVPQGHQLRVSISTTYWPMIWPTPEPVTLTVHTGASFIDVPVRKARRGERAPVFAPAEAAPPVKQKELVKPSNLREVTIDQRTGVQRLRIVDDFGRYEIAEHGMVIAACGREHYSIHPDDPLSARAECHWTEERARGDWKVRTETHSAMTASKTHFHVTGRLEAYEGDALVLTRSWDKKIKRQLL